MEILWVFLNHIKGLIIFVAERKEVVIIMKRFSLTLAFVLVFAMVMTQIAYANMDAPKNADIGSSITFEKNDTISVLSEVLDITVNGSKADITATYKMKNTADKAVTTQSMFLSPNIVDSGVRVVAGNKDISFTAESYALKYDTEIKTEDWQYVVLEEPNTASYDEGQTVDTLTFKMDFEPNEEYDVVVSYTYRLGGYPDYDFNVKTGRIKYCLAPAAMWKNFESLTINLHLDEDMPVVSSSNLKFKKIAARKYQYVSDTLPEGNLEIDIDENWYQNIFSTLKSPYLPMMLLTFWPFILIALAVVIVIIWHLRKKRYER